MPRLFLIACSMGFLWISSQNFIDPNQALLPIELQGESVSAMNELRSNYGGLHLGLGLYFLAGAWRASWHACTLLSVGLMLSGLVIGRLSSMALDGQPNGFVVGLLALELTTALVAWALLWRQRTVKNGV